MIVYDVSIRYHFCTKMAEGAALKLLNVLLLGRTGVGKSTTGNKLLNVDGENAANQATEGKLKKECPGMDNGWTLTSSSPMHACFNAERGSNSVTQRSEIIVNTEAGFVVDTRGFAPSYSMRNVFLENLQIMREVTASVKGLVLHRILYFLPQRDIPERADGFLQEELAIMWYYFGELVFRNLVIVITAPPRSAAANSNVDTHFGVGATFGVQKIFLEALRNAIHGREDATLSPCPNIVFIRFRASSESVAEIVRDAKVHVPDGIRLDFRKTTCSKCASVIHVRRRRDAASIVGVEVEEGIICIPEESKCHPAFIPKY